MLVLGAAVLGVTSEAAPFRCSRAAWAAVGPGNVSIVFAGDVSLARDMHAHGNRWHGGGLDYLFDGRGVRQILRGADLTVVNLESVRGFHL